jgi:hypothetical protein
MLLDFYRKVKNTFFYNLDEIVYLLKVPRVKKDLIYKQNILLNATEDYKSLCFGYLLSKEKKFYKYNFIFLLPLLSWYKVNYKKSFIRFIFSFYFNILILYFRNLKWKNLYKKFGTVFISFNNTNIIKEIFYIKKAEIILSGIKNKKQLQSLKINNIKVGDLVYDTYLRFSDKTTVDLNDFFLIEVFSKTLNTLEKVKKINLHYDINFFFTNQLAYIYHGIISRFIKNHKVKNFMWTSGAYYSSLSKYFYSYNFTKYKNIFMRLNFKKFKIDQAKNLLKEKFSGKIIPQENFMPLSAYNSEKKFIIPKIKGVIFLHCFVDSPTSRGNNIFDDFQDWTISTLNFFHKTNFDKVMAVKPHPDSKPPSLQFVNQLKKRFPDFIWLDPKISNKLIFEKKPLFGTTVMGTVLHELAYHNIMPISAGEHGALAYNFVKTAKNKIDYFDLLDKAINKKIKYKSKKKEIYEWVYMTYLHDDSEKDLFCKKINLKDWNFKDKKILTRFTKIVNEYSY